MQIHNTCLLTCKLGQMSKKIVIGRGGVNGVSRVTVHKRKSTNFIIIFREYCSKRQAEVQ